MLKIKIKTDKSLRIIIPIPYFALHIASSLICSDFIWKRIAQVENVNHNTPTRNYSTINKTLIKPLLKTTIKEFQNFRGTTIVDLKEADGTELVITL